MSRIVHGARTSLIVVGAAIALTMIVGVTVGTLAGYRGGFTDQVAMRIVDLVLSFPALLIAIILVAVLTPSTQSVIVVLVLSGWVTQARLIRGQVLSLRQREFVDAARVIGAQDTRIMRRHILPNVVPIATVIATIQGAQFVLLESALSFLGLGVQPPTPSWGSILNEGRAFVNTAWWIQTFPGVAIVLTVSGFGFLGDWLRDHLDPDLKVQ